jgi:hypothetical protein
MSDLFSTSPLRRRALRVLPLVLLTVFGCQKQVDFGTLPVVEVAYDAEPARPATPVPPPPAPAPAPALEGDLPDPVAARTAEQLRLAVAFERGHVRLVSTERVTLRQPVLTPRRVGRFAVELWIGDELLERVRFDFPLMAADGDAEALERGLTTSVEVEVPYLERATSARILDRKTRESVALPWPPSSAPLPAAAPAGPAAAPSGG